MLGNRLLGSIPCGIKDKRQGLRATCRSVRFVHNQTCDKCTLFGRIERRSGVSLSHGRAQISSLVRAGLYYSCRFTVSA